MEIKTFEQILEEVKSSPQETNKNSISGEEFEEWLKERKQNYEDKKR